MNANSPMVSVGTPVLNCEKTVGIAIRSILSQAYTDWELLVIDDGSEDRTPEIARGFGDARIRVSSDGRRKGLVARLNEAVALSRGKYFARMDGDDVSFPDRLEKQVEFLERNPDIDLLGAGVVVFRCDGQILGTRAIRTTHKEICRRPNSGFYLPHPTWMGKTEWFRENPYRDEALRCEDQDLLLRTYERSRFASLNEILLGYREETLSLSRISSGRRHFARSAVRAEIESRRYASAASAALEQTAKGVLDAVAIVTGLNYTILRHRALPANERTKRRWAEVWARVQRQESHEATALKTPQRPTTDPDRR